MSSPYSPSEDRELNEAIYNSMRDLHIGNNTQQQYIPVQTTTTFVPAPVPTQPLPFQNLYQTPTVNYPVPTVNIPRPTTGTAPIRPPLPPTSFGIRSPTAPIPIRSPTASIPIRSPSATQTSMRIPTLPTVQPTVRRPSIPTIPPLATSPLTPLSPVYSPTRTIRGTPDEDYQMKIAIMESMAGITPARDRAMSPIADEEDLMLQEAIRLSTEIAVQANHANYHAEQAAVASPPRRLLAEQDLAYEEALRIDREKEENARLAADNARQAAENAAKMSQLLKEAQEKAQREEALIQPPILDFPIENSNTGDIFNLRFRLPTGVTVNHSFNRREPLRSVIQQLRFDMKSNDSFGLIIPPRDVINCSERTSIEDCGIQNRIMVNVFFN